MRNKSGHPWILHTPDSVDQGNSGRPCGTARLRAFSPRCHGFLDAGIELAFRKAFTGGRRAVLLASCGSALLDGCRRCLILRSGLCGGSPQAVAHPERAAAEECHAAELRKYAVHRFAGGDRQRAV
jgi:hypothetical protein